MLRNIFLILGFLLVYLSTTLSGCSIVDNQTTLVDNDYIVSEFHTSYLEKNTQKVLLDVPMITQLPELPTGCELTSAAMVLSYGSAKSLDKMTLLEVMPYDDEDPNIGFVGDPRSEEGWTIYPQALGDVYENENFKPVDLTGASVEIIEQNISDGLPVILWLGSMHGLSLHVVVLTGFDAENFYINDPLTGEKNIAYGKDIIQSYWAEEAYRALGIQ